MFHKYCHTLLLVRLLQVSSLLINKVLLPVLNPSFSLIFFFFFAKLCTSLCMLIFTLEFGWCSQPVEFKLCYTDVKCVFMSGATKKRSNWCELTPRKTIRKTHFPSVQFLCSPGQLRESPQKQDFSINFQTICTSTHQNGLVFQTKLCSLHSSRLTFQDFRLNAGENF